MELYEKNNNPLRLLMIDNDMEDIKLVQEAFKEKKLPVSFDYLHNDEGFYNMLNTHVSSGNPGQSLPQLIFLDLNMNTKDGKEMLKEIKSHPQLSKVPVLIYSGSKSQKDINDAYSLGASCFFIKPLSFHELCNSMEILYRFWTNCAMLPQ